ncbi:MAG: hypothetical protein V1708_00200 [Candidatus Micrarchaeota archaeon]
MENVRLKKALSRSRAAKQSAGGGCAKLGEEMLTPKEISRLNRIFKEMEAGKEKPLEDILKEL